MQLDPFLLDFLDCLSDIPEDDVAWQHLSQLLAERDELEAAAFIRRDYPMIRTSLRMGWPEIAMIRGYAKQVNAYTVMLIDALTPRLRRPMIRAARLLKGPPPVPGKKVRR